jgi:predicted kinase
MRLASALASRIVSLASRTDPASDATAVVVRVRAEPMPGWLELSETPRRTAFGHAYVREAHRATMRREND